MTHNLKATINFKKKDTRNETQKSEGLLSWLVIGDGNSTSVYNDTKPQLVSWTEIEPHTAITNQPEEGKEKRQL